MKIIKILLILIIPLVINTKSKGSNIEVKVELHNEIITNIDIEDEIKYLLFLNPKLSELNSKKTTDIAKNSLINEIIKKKELEKYFDFNKENNIVNIIEKNLLKKKKIKNVEEFKKILEEKHINYEYVKKKLFIETLWNQFIYNKYSNNLVINDGELRNKILYKINNTNRKFQYNLSEIVINLGDEINIQNKIDKIIKDIKKLGFENSANIHSSSSSGKNGGLIGWINELQISDEIINNINQLRISEVSRPFRVNNSVILIKVNDKIELRDKINVEDELKKLINQETNRQLNSYSNIFYKRLKKNTEVNEY